MNERFEHALINTPAFFVSVRHYLCDVHEGATKEIISGGFGKNCFKLLNETHTCRRMILCVEKCARINETVVKVYGQGDFSTFGNRPVLQEQPTIYK